jgi:hypothetical protein
MYLQFVSDGVMLLFIFKGHPIVFPHSTILAFVYSLQFVFAVVSWSNRTKVILPFFSSWVFLFHTPCSEYMQKVFTGLLAHGWCAPLRAMVVFDIVMLLVMEVWMITRSNTTLWMMLAVQQMKWYFKLFRFISRTSMRICLLITSFTLFAT